MNKYQYKVKGVDYEVEIAEVEGNIAKVNVNGIPFEVELQKPINAAKHPTMTAPKVVAPKVAAPAAPVAAPAAAAPAAAAGAGNAIKAPLPGTVTMANNIESDYAGQVTSIVVKQGETVMEGAVLLTIA